MNMKKVIWFTQPQRISIPSSDSCHRNKTKYPSLKELKKYEGSGISYCAICDGFFYRQKEVAVLGHGLYALHEAKVLEPLASRVTILTNGKEPAFPLSQLGTIQVNTKAIHSAGGEPALSWLKLEDGSLFHLSGLFVALGTADSTDIARKLGWYWRITTLP